MKRLAKLLISLAVRCWDAAAAWALRLAGRQRPASCVVLYYHAIPAGQRNRFAAQMDRVVRCTRPIPAGHAGPLEPGHRYSAVTFDDGFLSVIENALPELESRGIPATLFVPTGSLGGPPLWIRNGEAPASRERVLAADELRALKRTALLTIGSHSVSHPDLVKIEAAKARAELADSRSALERILDTEVTLFSFPHGAHDDRLVRLARETGYRRVFTISPRPAFASANEFVTGRVLVDPSDWPAEFKLKLLGAYRWIPAVSALKAWLLGRSRSTSGLF